MLSEARHSQSIGILATALALVLGLSVAGGCASGGDEGATASGSGTSAGSDEAYPNLGDVPDRPATMTEEQRRRLEQGLVADSQGRAYSEEVIAFQADPTEPLPAPMETGAGGAPTSTLGDVRMPGAVSPPFSSVPDTPPAAPSAASSGAPTAATGAAAAAAAASVPTAPSAPTAISAPPAATTSSVSAAAAAAQATPPNIPVPPDDPMARATTPPFSGATAPPPPVASVPPTPVASVPPTPVASVPPAPSVASPTAAYAPSTPSYTPVPSAPTALSGDPSTSNLNRAQLDSLQPTPPPFSGTTGATPGSYAPTSLTGTATATTAPTAVTSAYAPTSATPAYAPAAATSADVPPSATSAYAPPPAVPAEPPPVGVREVFEARLQDTLPSQPLADLPPAGDLVGDEPLTTVVVSSSGVATFEELPVDVPVLEREPVAAAVPGAQRRSLARSAVPSNSVKVATILFGDGSSDLRGREREIVREVYERYLASGRKVRVVGHSSSRTRNMDPVRHRMVNFGLSAERANAVAIELQRLGVPSEQITVVAAADDMPMYYEVMPSGEAGNRRTEIYLD